MFEDRIKTNILIEKIKNMYDLKAIEDFLEYYFLS
jgi:hypothetical protein